MKAADDNGSPSSSAAWAIAAWASLPVQVALLAAAGVANRYQMNPDGVVYMRLAEYVLAGEWSLFVTGYWGPLLSVLIAGLMAVGVEVMAAARTAVAASAVALLVGTICLLRTLRLSPRSVVVGAWAVALATISWSIIYVTPDLLLAALVVGGVAALTPPQWVTSRRVQIGAGALWAGAYLAKPIGFPLAVCSIAGFVFLHWFATERIRDITKAAAVTIAVFAAISAPWMVALSLRYGKPTFSTSGAIAYAAVGPQRIPGLHPFTFILHQPERGRILSWEDPDASWYHPWSPFSDANAAKHQWLVMRENAAAIERWVASFGRLRIAWVALILGVFLGGFTREAVRALRWRWMSVPVLALFVLYLTVYAADERYFYPVMPLLMAPALGAAEWLASKVRRDATWAPAVAPWLVGVLFLLPSFSRWPDALQKRTSPGSVYAHYLKSGLTSSGIVGPVAGGGIPAGQTGMYLAFLLRQPWYGDEPLPRADDFARSGAALALVPRRDGLSDAFDDDGRFENLDPILFADAQDASTFPLKVYRIRSAQP